MKLVTNVGGPIIIFPERDEYGEVGAFFVAVFDDETGEVVALLPTDEYFTQRVLALGRTVELDGPNVVNAKEWFNPRTDGEVMDALSDLIDRSKDWVLGVSGPKEES